MFPSSQPYLGERIAQLLEDTAGFLFHPLRSVLRVLGSWQKEDANIRGGACRVASCCLNIKGTEPHP